jgi:delta 1-pyrroline-5-carboxylate dehydrogenase
VACTGPSDEALAAQLAFCKSNGLEGFAARDAACDAAWYKRADLGAVLMAEWNAPLAKSLSAVRADIVNLVVASEGTYPLWRLLDERSVSDNIAAAGGNVELLVQ